MQRYFVCRHWIKWKGKIYKKGELLPENFTHHDKARNIYNSRIGMCEVTEETAPESVQAPKPPATPSAPISGQSPTQPIKAPIQTGSAQAAGKPAFSFKPATTGTPK